MLHHVSIPARDPRHVAETLAELLGGRAYPFPGPLPGAFVAVAGDAQGTAVEVYPEGVTLLPGAGDDGARFAPSADGGTATPQSWPFHALISVPREQADIERIGAREGWRAKYVGRGAPGQAPVFHLIELWVENRVMIEVMTERMAATYRQVLQFGPLDRHFASRQPAGSAG